MYGTVWRSRPVSRDGRLFLGQGMVQGGKEWSLFAC